MVKRETIVILNTKKVIPTKIRVMELEEEEIEMEIKTATRVMMTALMIPRMMVMAATEKRRKSD